jgi:hypothetical protein
MLCGAFRMLYRAFTMLHLGGPMLHRASRMLCHAFTMLFRAFRMLHQAFKMLHPEGMEEHLFESAGVIFAGNRPARRLSRALVTPVFVWTPPSLQPAELYLRRDE